MTSISKLQRAMRRIEQVKEYREISNRQTSESNGKLSEISNPTLVEPSNTPVECCPESVCLVSPTNAS